MMRRSISVDKKPISLMKPLFFLLLLLIISIFICSRYQCKPKPVYVTIQNQSLATTKPPVVHIRRQNIIRLKNVSIRCIISVNSRYGRFGNRMFSIATAYALARRHSCHLYIAPLILEEVKSIFVFDFQSILLPYFQFNLIVQNKINPMKQIVKDIGCQYIPELISPNAISQGTIFELRGFWQSYLHFVNYRNELQSRIFAATQPVLEKISKFFIHLYQQNFGFKPAFSLENHQSFKKQLAQSNKTTWVGVHVRRSDFLDNGYASSDEYLLNAIEYYTKRYSNAHFIVASDDRSYCKNLFRNRPNIFFTPTSFSVGDDFITLSLCQHSIITGGTFGWWSAYLANGEVVHDTAYSTGCEKDEHYYPPWFRNDDDVIIYIHTL
jgi:galactoside 2-L-fucosyltransferase 1/2